MAFIIPNATDTASGAKYENLDQAEPDSLDFEILGNAGRSGVVSGCAVTALPASNTSVAVSSGIVVINGSPYTVAGQSSYSLPTAPTDNRFDLVVARLSGGVVSLVTVQGNDESTNPEFPKSVNTLASGVLFDGSIHVDLSTDVVLAAIYRQDAQNITASRIADRRVFTTSSIVSQGSTDPSTGVGTTGSLYFKTGVAQGSTASGVFVKNALGSWVELAQNTGPQVPVGTLLPWVGTSSAPSGYLEADGSVVSRATYSELFAVLGTKYGAGDGSTTFGLPNLNGKHLRGTTSTVNVGTNTGSDTHTLSESQLPSHSHSISHTHTLAHTHGIGHNHSITLNNQSANHTHSLVANTNTTVNARANAGNTAGTGGNHNHSGGGHNHTLNSTNTSSTGGHNHSVSTATIEGGFPFYGHKHGGSDINNLSFEPSSNGANVVFAGVDINSGYAANYTTDLANGSVAANGNTSSTGTHNHSVNAPTTNYDATNNASQGSHSHNSDGSHYHNLTANLNSQSANHNHTVSAINQTTNTTSSQSESTTSGANNTNTGSVGSGSSISNIPASTYVRWLIRATGTTIATAQDGSNILAEALEEVVTVELVGSGSLPASQTGVGYYRMPWAATLTGVKANLNGTATSEISIDINESGTSVLSTVLTIDAGESSSLSAATPAVISDSTVADDALLTFDIDAADTGDTGPLTVTLYFTRSA